MKQRGTATICAVATALAALIALAPAPWAGLGDECLACHGDSSITMERKGRSVSLFVDRAALERSSL